MPILAFDCCFSSVSAAVLEFERPADSRLLAVRHETMETGQAERLVPMLAEVMREARTDFASLSAIAVTVGPGTFTGIRNGVAAARGLALARGLPVLTLSSLTLMARTAMANQQIAEAAAGATLAVAMDARQGMIFFQAFATADRRPLDGPALLAPAQAADRLDANPILVVGSAAVALAAACHAKSRPASADLPKVQPDARWVSPYDLTRADPPRPLYLRQPDARPQTGASLARATT